MSLVESKFTQAVFPLLLLMGLIASGCGDSKDPAAEIERTTVKIALYSPDNGQVVSKDKIKITGRVVPATALVYTDDDNAVPTKPDGTFSSTEDLDMGENNIDMYATEGSSKDQISIAVTRKHSKQELAALKAKKKRAAAKVRAKRAAAAERKRARIAAQTKSFSGSGLKNLGTIRITRGSTLKWTNDGDIFQIFTGDADVWANSQANSGDTYVGPGTYTDVEVNAIGNWTITISPE